MFAFWIILALSLWILYNFCTVIFQTLPFINLYNGGSSIIETINMIAIKWSLLIGVVLMFVGIFGLIFGKRETNNLSGMKYPILIFSVLYSIALLL